VELKPVNHSRAVLLANTLVIASADKLMDLLAFPIPVCMIQMVETNLKSGELIHADN
jgi:hypothetical protein